MSEVTLLYTTNGKGNCHKLIERESNFPRSNLYHPLFVQFENKNAKKYLFCKRTMCRIINNYMVFYITIQLNYLSTVGHEDMIINNYFL